MGLIGNTLKSELPWKGRKGENVKADQHVSYMQYRLKPESLPHGVSEHNYKNIIPSFHKHCLDWDGLARVLFIVSCE